MRIADFKARIKKIEITNKTLADSWQQSIRVVLGDIDLTNENLLELRQFKPNENVFVTIEAGQQQLSIIPGGAAPGQEGNMAEREEIENGFSGDGDGTEGVVVKAWNF